ncbi:DUF58 domain-containing protein [Thermomicrobium sp. 4228-Ro]|uniref:DUF58 domain-containing protein n=1 Tax=Thermomicrobium sp. 4228-Ro TaxID=2993937 RepID=UPI002248E380|nr:DUF58 domain-containing protein [Thermomicrobium sp. 4228-Ro]MCX2726191.1 DUF58 domain-containing protein [Thermomicrobium sp. 4228-Ro]
MMGWVRVVALALIVLFLSQLNRWVVFDKLFFVLVTVLLVSFVWSRLALSGLAVRRRTVTDRAHVGDQLVEYVELENRSRLGKLWVEVIDQSDLPGHRLSRVVTLGGHAKVSWRAKTWCTRRGRFRLGPMVLRSGDPFGLFECRVLIPATHQLVVYPAVVDLSTVRLPAGELPGGSQLQKRTPYVTPNVASIRQYQPGDSFNRIAWSASARAGQLMVKEFELDPSTDLWLVVDGDRRHHVRLSIDGGERGSTGIEAWLDSTEEYAVTIAASLARFFLEQNRAVGLIAQGARPIVLPTDRGARQLVKMLEFLADFHAEGTEPLQNVLLAEQAHFGRQSSLIIITPSTDEAWVRVLADLVVRSVRALAVLVEPSTFGGTESSLLVVSELAALGVPFVLVKYGDDLRRALATPAGLALANGTR